MKGKVIRVRKYYVDYYSDYLHSEHDRHCLNSFWNNRILRRATLKVLSQVLSVGFNEYIKWSTPVKKRKVKICPTPLHTFWSKYDVIPKLCRHVAHYVIGCSWKKGPQPGQIRFDIFTRFKRGGVGLSTRVQDLSKPYVISQVKAVPASVYQYALQMWLRQTKMCVASGVVVLWRRIEVWWRYVHWFPFDITCDMTCDMTFELALVVSGLRSVWPWMKPRSI